MIGFLIALAVVWIILSILGFTIHAIAWLAYVGIILLIVTVIVGAIMRFVGRRS